MVMIRCESGQIKTRSRSGIVLLLHGAALGNPDDQGNAGGDGQFDSCAFVWRAFYLREGGTLFDKPALDSFAGARGLSYGGWCCFVILIRVLTLRYTISPASGGFSSSICIRFSSQPHRITIIVAVGVSVRGGFNYRAFSYGRSVFVLDS